MGKAERKKFIEEEIAQISVQDRSQKSETDLVKDAARRWESLSVFKKKLEGWMTNLDGENYCPQHWQEYLSKFEGEHRRTVEEDASPTAKWAESRRSLDGWFAQCEICGADVYVPF